MQSTNEINGINYIIINDVEYGGFAFSIKSLTINQNEVLSRSKADGFMLQFER